MCAHNCVKHCELCAAMCVRIILFPARQFRKFSGIVRSIVCGNVRSQLCEALWIVCGNVAWFGMVGRKRLYERKEVMVWSPLTDELTNKGRYRAARAFSILFVHWLISIWSKPLDLGSRFRVSRSRIRSSNLTMSIPQLLPHPVSRPNSSVTLLRSRAPLN